MRLIIEISFINLVVIRFNMNQTIKDKIQTQIYFNQKLLSYDDSDSSEQSDEETNNSDLPTQEKFTILMQNKPEYHGNMNQKRRQVLKQLQNVHNVSPKENQQCRPLKNYSRSQTSVNENRTIVELKSKLAQVLKELQQKTSMIKQLQRHKVQSSIRISELQCLLSQKQNHLEIKQIQLQRSNFQSQKLTEEYQMRLQQTQEEFEQKNQQILKIKVTIEMKNQRLSQMEYLLKLKDQEISRILNNQIKENKYLTQNKKLKKDINRLLSLLESSSQYQNMQKSHKRIIESKLNSFKFKKTRTISMQSQNLYLNTKKKTHQSVSKLIQCNYVSLNQKPLTIIKQKSSLSWFPSLLIKQVEQFLKKWHIAHNNDKFVNSLVEFVNEYTDKCINQNRSRMQNQYKSLKKEILRKANHSLSLQQIMKQRELKFKLNNSQNIQNKKKSTQKFQCDFKPQNMTFTSDVSILIPASNKKHIEHKNNLLTVSLLNEKSMLKDEISYNNLQKSIRLHRKTSGNKINQHESSDLYVNQKIMQIFSKKNKKPHRKSKTQSSIDPLNNFSRKVYKNSSNRKRSNSLMKNYDFPLENYKLN